MGPPGDTGSKGTEVSGLLKRGLLKLHVEFKKQKRRHFYKDEMIQKQGEWVQALNGWSMYRPIRLTQCCIQFKSPGVKILCVLYLHYKLAFTFK